MRPRMTMARRRRGSLPAIRLRERDVPEMLRKQDRTWLPPDTGFQDSNSGYVTSALVIRSSR